MRLSTPRYVAHGSPGKVKDTLKWIIGHGGMSTVWLADDVNNGNREVAIKVLRPEFSDNSEFLSRLRNEALAAEKIDYDNVVQT